MEYSRLTVEKCKHATHVSDIIFLCSCVQIQNEKVGCKVSSQVGDYMFRIHGFWNKY